MLLLRLAGVFVALAVAAGVVAFLFTRDRRFLSLSWRIAKYALIIILVIAALFLLERVAAIL